MSLAIAFGGCGGGGGAGGGGGSGEKTNDAFQLVADPVLVTADQGAGALVKVTVTRAAAFADDITLSLSTAVAGIDAGGVIVSGSMTSGWLQISIAPSVTVGGPVDLTVTGTSGNRIATKVLSLTIRAAEPSSQGEIANAQAAGVLDAGTTLLYRAYALFGDPRLPPNYVGSGSAEEDNDLLTDIRAAWAGLTSDLQTLLLPFTLRPSDPGSWLAI